MKKYFIVGVIEILLLSAVYYVFLPAINIQTTGFWAFVSFAALSLGFLISIARSGSDVIRIKKGKTKEEIPKSISIPVAGVALIIALTIIINFICGPLFNAKSYSNRIIVDETGDFTKDIEEVNFNSLPLLDRESSEKLGDRVMGKMSELVSQYYVSEQYTQINYNNDIVRVTPLEYADFIKWFSNRKDGVKGYIIVNSVNGESELIKMDKGMKYMESAYFNENLTRKLRFSYPTTSFGDPKFEIDNDGNPYWVVPTYGYTGIELKTRITGVIILNPIDGTSKKYDLEDVPTWVDNAYNASLLIEQIDDWGTYRDGFLNSIFGQKNVVNTTDGYNYLAMNDDIYMYTGITSVLSDESNLGFVLSNLRTGKTVFYSVPGAEEYSAMSSAEGQVQQMSYSSTFPLLINLNNKPTYLVSLKDDAGLVKMYGFIDVEDYQKVVVTESSKGIKTAAQNYLNSYADEISEDLLIKEEITIKKINTVVKSGNSYYYITGENGKKYVLSISLGDSIAFLSVGDKINIGYFDKGTDIIEVNKIY